MNHKIIILKIGILILLFNPCPVLSQSLNPFYQAVVNSVSFDTLMNSLRKFQSLGIKAAPSASLNNTATWLVNTYTGSGYTDIKRDTFINGNDTLFNIVVTKTGLTYPETFLIIDGHYDTNTGPGVNDNGSGTSVILEIARLMQNIPTEYSVRFIHFTGEEDGYLGSHYYVNDIVTPQNMDIRLVLNIDEVGGVAGEINNKIVCEKDMSPPSGNNAASAAFTDTLANLVQLYSSLSASINFAYGSDYVPFQQAGKVITGLFEKNQSQQIHSLDDSLKNLDTNYVFEVAKAATGAALYLAGAIANTNHDDLLKKNGNAIAISPNPFQKFVFINGLPQDDGNEFLLFNCKGQKIFSLMLNPGKPYIFFNELPASIYQYQVINNKRRVVLKTGKLIKIE
ncbi:MAG: M28 family peptidase [Bacteroidia bacterium]|nr:M28 family peptidase [Bacteroidia bacterium]